MSYLVSDLKNDVSRKLHGTSLNKVEGVDDLIDEASRQVLADIDPKNTIRIEEISSPTLLYGTYRYTAPTDLKGDKIIDIRALALRDSDDTYTKRGMEHFDRNKSYGTFNVEYDSGTKSICLPEATVDKLGSTVELTVELVYYSSYMYRTSTGTWKENADDDDDLINLETDSYNLMVYKTAELASDQISGKDAGFDYSIYSKKYEEGLKKYTSNYPSENIKPQFRYY